MKQHSDSLSTTIRSLRVLACLAAALFVLVPCQAVIILTNAPGFNDWQDHGCGESLGGMNTGTLTPAGNSSTCVPCEGMPVWWVTEPFINLWIADEPLSYFTSRGQRVAFRWTYHTRQPLPPVSSYFLLGSTNYGGQVSALPSGRDTTLTAGMRGAGLTNAVWCHNWMSELVFWDLAWETNAAYHAQARYSSHCEVLWFRPDGGIEYFPHVGATGAVSRVRLEALNPLDYPTIGALEQSPDSYYWETASTNGFRLVYPDGSVDVFGLATPIVSNWAAVTNTTARAWLSRRISREGHVIQVGYGANGSTADLRVARLQDPDQRRVTFTYAKSTTFQLSSVSDPYDRQASFAYEGGSGLLTNIVDTVGLTNRFVYYYTNSFPYSDPTNARLTHFITPYGTTRFYTHESTSVWCGEAGINRSLRVQGPDGAWQIYFYRNQGTNLLQQCPDGDVPETVSGFIYDRGSTNGTFGESWFRNSFFWDRRQCQVLESRYGTNLFSTGTVAPEAILAAADYNLGRTRHWLLDGRDGTLSSLASWERGPSHDTQGAQEASRVWHAYSSQNTTNAHLLSSGATTAMLAAQRLPAGETHYVVEHYGGQGELSQRIARYSDSNASLALRTNTFSYSMDLDPVHAVAPDGTTNHFGYNTNHQVTAVTNALGEITSLAYDEFTGNLGYVALPGGEEAFLYYYPTSPAGPDAGFVSQIAWSSGASRVFTYTNGLPHTVTDERSLTVTNQWDRLNRLTSTRFPDGTGFSNVYARLDLAASQDRLGNWTRYGHDARQHLTRVTNSLNRVTQLEWCGCGALESITDALTNTTLFYYDNAGRLTNTALADGSQSFRDYDSAGRLWRVRDGTGRWQTFSYNNQGLVTAVSNAVGRVLAVQYDILDRPVQVTDALGVTVTNTFDAVGRLLRRQWPGGAEAWGYTLNVSAATSHTNALGAVTRYTYDSAGRLIETVWLTSGGLALATNSFTYDPDGALATLTDGNDHTTAWHRDEYGRVTNKIAHGGSVVFTNGFNANGNLIAHWTPEKGLIEASFDPLGNLTNVATVGQASRLSLTYDALSQLRALVAVSGTDHLTNIFAYTKTGQLVSEDGPFDNDTVSYGYTSGHRTSVGLNNESWSYTYDSAWRLSEITNGARVFGYDYGNPALGIRRLPAAVALPNLASLTNHFDSLGRLAYTALLNRSGNVLDGYSYAHDALGLRTNLTRDFGLAGSQVAIGYDAIGELTSWSAREAGSSALRLHEQLGYAYDSAGNLLRRTNNALVQSFASNGRNELTNITRIGTLTVSGATPGPASNVTVNGQSAARYADFTWASGSGFALTSGVNTFTNAATRTNGSSVTNTLTVTLPESVALLYDRNGNLTNDGWRSFEYDRDDQLTAVSVAGTWRTEFVYDGLGRKRIERGYGCSGSSWNQTNEVRFVYDGMLVIQERDAANNALATYTRGLDLSGSPQGSGGIGGLLARTDHTVADQRLATTFYHSDGAGNVTALTDWRGDVVARYVYDPYGRLLGKWGPLADANRYRFSSKEWQPQAGLYYYGFRFYEPNLQRWLNHDPLGEAGGINLYGFVGNSPVNAGDANGLLFSGFFGDVGTIVGSWFTGDARGANPNTYIAQRTALLGPTDNFVPNMVHDLVQQTGDIGTDMAAAEGAGRVAGAALECAANAWRSWRTAQAAAELTSAANLANRAHNFVVPAAKGAGSTADFSLMFGNKGILGTINDKGIVEFVVEAGPGSPMRGGQMFQQMMEHFGSNVKGVAGNWYYGDNLAAVNQLTAQGVSLEKAVSQTWTAGQAAKYGFSTPAVQSAVGNPGNYSKIQVIFSKP
jgi:RHS repeat-associated protein